MIETFFTGLFIGLCVSAPVGPIGVLCIQRTIAKGRRHGLVTGLGATTSDLIYALTVGLGMTFIMDFIETHQIAIQITGSVIICLFGAKIFFSKKAPRLPDTEKRKVSKSDLLSDYLTGFALCFSNPMIIFLFLGLFARFSVIDAGDPVKTILGMTSILLGATLWWFILTIIVGGYMSSRFKLRGLKILNKVTGSVLVILGIAGTIMAFNNYTI